jgi:hypothetical protein
MSFLTFYYFGTVPFFKATIYLHFFLQFEWLVVIVLETLSLFNSKLQAFFCLFQHFFNLCFVRPMINPKPHWLRFTRILHWV